VTVGFKEVTAAVMLEWEIGDLPRIYGEIDCFRCCKVLVGLKMLACSAFKAEWLPHNFSSSFLGDSLSLLFFIRFFIFAHF
jgi:hypothetical protein